MRRSGLVYLSSSRICTLVSFLSFLFFCSFFYCSDPVVNEILSKREQQNFSSHSLYFILDSQIQKIKQSHGNHQQHVFSRVEELSSRVIHLFPFIIWQILFFMILVLVLFNRKNYFLLCVVLLLFSIIFIEFRKRSHKIMVIPHDNAQLYLGPATSYPVRMPLHYLDEVIIKKRHPNGWLQVSRSGIVGWMRDE